MPQRQWHSHWGIKGGRVPPLTAKNLPKIGKKSGKKGKVRKKKAKSGKVLSLCPSWQIGLATLLLRDIRGRGLPALYYNRDMGEFTPCLPPSPHMPLQKLLVLPLYNSTSELQPSFQHLHEGTWAWRMNGFKTPRNLHWSFCSARWPAEATDVNPTLLRSSWCCLAILFSCPLLGLLLVVSPSEVLRKHGYFSVCKCSCNATI